MTSLLISPHPGYLPTKPEPKTGERVVLKVDGLPPYKDFNSSIRNPRHRFYNRFLVLREIATLEMNGRKWTDREIAMKVSVFAPSMEKGRDLCAYVGGIMDTLDGSHGYHFTYLPIVYQDDSQVAWIDSRFVESSESRYTVEIEFVQHLKKHGMSSRCESDATV
jgi:hypothetical protein